MVNLGFLFVGVCFLISVVYSFKEKNIFNPLLLFVSTLFLQYSIYFFVYKSEYLISDKTIYIYICGLVFYLMGFILCDLIEQNKKKYESLEKKYVTNWLFIYFCLILGIVFMFLSRDFLQELNVTDFNLGSKSANLREAFVYSLDSIPFYVTYGKYFLLFSISFIFYEHLNGRKKFNRFFLLILGLLLLINSFAVMSRTDLLITILPFLIIWISSANFKDVKGKIKKKSKKSKYGIVSLVFFLLIMMNGMRVIDKSDSIFSKDNVVMQYIGKPIIAFDQWILQHSAESNELLFFEPLNKVLLKLKIIEPDNFNLAKLGQFNVYSYLKVPYLEFGTFGVIFIMFFVGVFCAFLYNKYKTGKRNWVIFYSFYSYACVMSFFDWQFGITTYTYLVVFLGLSSILQTDIFKKKSIDEKRHGIV
ncbi:O-antigen polymerase [Vagococcus fluvialis]|uniref:O-antigen polymerase n=1 Tax=Vagococcus fluvialis TaxID=2738 RepID=UPI001A8C5D45|nr:O-antigen polymerase [Vagococcus fluvialis]MBO0437909.1 oligosaccharide repeat unit polymerase [Vagococcus fluvialis]